MTTPLSKRLQHFIPFDEWPESIIEELSPHFRLHQLSARKILFKRGQDDDECHFLLEGSIDLADDNFNVNTISADDDDNFMALDSTHSVHRYSGITQTPCNIVSVKRGYLDLISTWSEFCQHTGEQDADDETDWLERLITSELFARIPPANIQKLLSRFEELPAALGDVIVREGEIGEHCFVIKTGSALITRKQNQQDETLAVLNPGDLFGEDALISQLPRNATVTMTTSGTLARLAKDDFDPLLKKPVLNYLPESKLNTLIDEADTGVIILDVRHSQESNASPMVRARSVSLSTLRETLKTFERDFIYAIVGGGRAEAAAYILSEAGFDARVVT
ncbi:cyclic nucleotide-binding domain-containing protein [Thalassolituus maritimus]|uniref:Calcium-binding protein n=2 Tax=Thalassolituus TaxID=187492 RepID=A0ABP9ZVS6_9GAMM